MGLLRCFAAISYVLQPPGIPSLRKVSTSFGWSFRKCGERSFGTLPFRGGRGFDFPNASELALLSHRLMAVTSLPPGLENVISSLKQHQC
jgi:hypothetical protein